MQYCSIVEAVTFLLPTDPPSDHDIPTVQAHSSKHVKRRLACSLHLYSLRLRFATQFGTDRITHGGFSWAVTARIIETGAWCLTTTTTTTTTPHNLNFLLTYLAFRNRSKWVTKTLSIWLSSPSRPSAMRVSTPSAIQWWDQN
jgi:hypothetical protein